MDKLGYTFYPKDWWTSATFFKLPPELRYLYLEIISMMYMDDGKWEANRYELHKRFGVDPGDKGWEMLESMFVLDGKFWTHASVNKRLRKAIVNRENGKNGGRPKLAQIQIKETQKTQLVNPKKPTLERERESEGEIETYWSGWGELIVAGRDQFWEQMKGRKVDQAEMNTFLSVASTHNWQMPTQQRFRIALQGFDKDKFKTVKTEAKNKYKIQ